MLLPSKIYEFSTENYCDLTSANVSAIFSELDPSYDTGTDGISIKAFP